MATALRASLAVLQYPSIIRPGCASLLVRDGCRGLEINTSNVGDPGHKQAYAETEPEPETAPGDPAERDGRNE